MLTKLPPALALAALLTALLPGCGSENTAPAAPPPQPTEAAAAADPPQLPPIPVDSLEFLWNNATYLDATFYELPVSINQNSVEQIRSSITYVAETPAHRRAACKPIGRIWFQVDGRNRQEADIHYGPGCNYYVWYVGGKPTYSNELTSYGTEFYANIFRSVQQQTQPNQ